MFFNRTLLTAAFMLMNFPLVAEEQALLPLPQPLTLEQALELSENHPNIRLAESGVAYKQAESDEVLAESGFNVTARGYLTAVEPSSVSFNRSNNDSKVILLARKKLYDFGYSRARESAAENAVNSQKWQLLNQRQHHQLGVVQYFFDVLIADKDYVLKNEEMTMAYLKYDKAKDRNDLGTVSDIELLRLENIYREMLQLRRVAEQEQRLSRLRLAAALNRPPEGQPPENQGHAVSAADQQNGMATFASRKGPGFHSGP